MTLCEKMNILGQKQEAKLYKTRRFILENGVITRSESTKKGRGSVHNTTRNYKKNSRKKKLGENTYRDNRENRDKLTITVAIE